MMMYGIPHNFLADFHDDVWNSPYFSCRFPWWCRASPIISYRFPSWWCMACPIISYRFPWCNYGIHHPWLWWDTFWWHSIPICEWRWIAGRMWMGKNWKGSRCLISHLGNTILGGFRKVKEFWTIPNLHQPLWLMTTDKKKEQTLH